MSGILTLVPTPISDEVKYSDQLVQSLQNACQNDALIVVEEHKVARRKWVANGLPREQIDQFVLYNEHTRDKELPQLLSELKRGRDVYLISDCGMPAFCDPGQDLVEACHARGHRVTSLNFPNSIVLAVALSGFPHDSFKFEGFIEREDRLGHLKRCLQNKCTTVLMDTPYRLQKLLSELEQLNINRELFIGIDLNSPQELVKRGFIGNIVKDLNNINKREFVIVLGPYERTKKTRSY